MTTKIALHSLGLMNQDLLILLQTYLDSQINLNIKIIFTPINKKNKKLPNLAMCVIYGDKLRSKISYNFKRTVHEKSYFTVDSHSLGMLSIMAPFKILPSIWCLLFYQFYFSCQSCKQNNRHLNLRKEKQKSMSHRLTKMQ